jgi:ATP-dependent helicase/nuclease subunit B
VGLTLVAGPANAGKVALLLDRYVAAIERDPVLVVPGRPDVQRVERELLARSPVLLGGSVGTFDDLFARVARSGGERRPVLTELQRALVVRRAVAATSLNGLAPSAGQPGFADALAEALRELAAGLVSPEALGGATVGALYRAYLAELDGLAVWDRDRERGHAVTRLESDLEAWDGRPVFAYGFEDVTAAQWRLLAALAGRAEVTVSLPYEAGRPAFASLSRTAEDLAALADGRVEWHGPRYADVAHPALAHLERTLFSDAEAPGAPPLEGAIRWLEGAGDRATLELVADEVLELLRGGLAPGRIALVCPSLDRVRAPLETAFATAGVPFHVDAPVRLEATPLGKALLGLLRFEWRGQTRRDLFRFLRSPYSGLARAHADFLEGRLRGRAIRDERVEEEVVRLRGQTIPPLDLVRGQADPVAAARALATSMLRAAHGVDAPAAGEVVRGDLRAHESVLRVLGELDGWERLAAPPTREEVLAALERAAVPPPPGAAAGSVAVLDLMRARTIRADVVFVLGLEGGSLPRRGAATPFLDDDVRRDLGHDARLARPDGAARDRYLFYTACTRASRRLVLVRAAANDDGAPREPSPFWDETRVPFDADEVARWTRRRPLSTLTWPLEQAPTERERVRALAALASGDPDAAASLALANGWERRLERALGAFDRPVRLTHPHVLEELAARTSFGVTELERFADCSSMWLVERLVSPRSIDAEPDARLRGQVAHSALHKFFAGLPKRLGVERVEPDRLDESLTFLRECLEEALAGVRLDLSDLERRELEGGLWRDLEGLVRAEAELDVALVPRRFELSFGSERSAPELQRGLDLGGFSLSGKIDRVDLDPFAARGIVQDYKSGASAPSAKKIEQELRLQIPLYMLVLRDLVGVEPLGGVYRPLAGRREPRGLLRADDGVSGYHRNDYVSDDEFWRQVDLAADRARTIVGRMREGDVRHDPKGGDCPDWCSLWSMCRVRRA